jgi:4-diphosphocytidyl-2-C-methyl-D-erythritol kinase
VLRASARAKINLGLEVLGRRADSYHEIATILQQIDLADELSLSESTDLTLTADADLGDTETNLVLRAARLLRESSGTNQGVAIHLRKAIPVAAGLGGGSADAAAALLALNDLWGLGQDRDALGAMARELGSDVPFFLDGGTQLATGRGDELAPLPTPSLSVVLVISREIVPDKTRRLYGMLRPDDWSDGRRVRGIAEAIRSGRSVPPPLPSGFQRAAFGLFPSLGATFDAIREAGGTPSLCGAGPAVLSLHTTDVEARLVARRLTTTGREVLVARTVSGRGDWTSAP